jgi:hypothetical protein
MKMPAPTYWAWFASLIPGVCNMALATSKGMLRPFPWFLGLLTASSGLGIVWWAATPLLSPWGYGAALIFHQSAVLFATMMFVYSLWKAGLGEYRGLHRLCLALLGLALGSGMIAVIFTTRMASDAPASPATWILQWVFLFLRSAMFVVTVPLFVFFGFVAAFRIEMNRTVRDLALALFFFVSTHVLLDAWTYLGGIQGGALLSYVKQGTTFTFQAISFATIVRYRADQSLETHVSAFDGSREELERRMDAIDQALLHLTGTGRR